MLRLILGVVAGVIAGFVVVSIVQATGHAVYPVATGIDVNDRAAMQALIASLPLGALAFVLLSWIAGAYVASMIALLIGSRRRVAGLIAGGLVLLATIANLLMLPHPGWMSATGIGGILLAIWLADALFSRGAAA